MASSTMPFETVSPRIDGTPPRLRITDVECHVLLAPDYDVSFTSSAQDSFVVVIRTDGGVTGIGECDANPWMAKACIEAPGTHTMGLCIKEMLIGSDPFLIGDLWTKMYLGTAMNGRRGMVIHAMSAIDMALWDLCGKAVGKPVHDLLGGATRSHVTPYARRSRQGTGSRISRRACASAQNAKNLGFKAMKTEITMNGPHAHGGMRETYERHTEVLAAVRKSIGPDVTLMVDVQYLWEDSATCLDTVKDWGEFGIYFLETPLWSDNVQEMARLVEKAPMPIAFGNGCDPLRVPGVAGRRKGVAQPDVGRVISARPRSSRHGHGAWPHHRAALWKTGILFRHGAPCLGDRPLPISSICRLSYAVEAVPGTGA
jgi:L-alanine-DL-glutamate epimerase-like enolase superfamily enzyme